jgi:hypothetical protein
LDIRFSLKDITLVDATEPHTMFLAATAKQRGGRWRRAMAPLPVGRCMAPLSYRSFCRLILKLLPTTLTLESAMAPAAIMGLSRPKAASGIAARL